MTSGSPKRLIEVDLPIKRISAHAVREKSIRHGHISTLHIWWARRPLAACRAVLCASLWPDPADPKCPESFREVARRLMAKWSTVYLKSLGKESYNRFVKFKNDPGKLNEYVELRSALLDFIADFANWNNSAKEEYLETSRALTQAAHEALNGSVGTRPLVVDPFAGGGSIPLEALRVGADAFASDLNPVAVLLNKVSVEYVPRFGERLADEVIKWGEWIREKAENELASFYPKDQSGSTTVAYLWARTVQCEGPGCGSEVPLVRSLWLAKKANRFVALQIVPQPAKKRVGFKIIVKQPDGWFEQDDEKKKVQEPKFDGTVRRGSASCPCCGYTTPVARIRAQLKARHAGTFDARLMCVISEQAGNKGVQYRIPQPQDEAASEQASRRLLEMSAANKRSLTVVPDEPYPDESASGALSASVLYGFQSWGDLFPRRAALALSVFSELVRKVSDEIEDAEMSQAVATCLAFCVSKLADYLSSLCVWRTARSCAAHTFGRQALPMAWDFAEMNPFAGTAGDWAEAVRYLSLFIETSIAATSGHEGTVSKSSATLQPLPDDSAQIICTDPPYYDAIAYGDLSDFFYVWLRRILADIHPGLFAASLVNKDDEIVQLSKRFPGQYGHKTKEFFETEMTKALRESRRVVQPDGVGVVVFAHKSTSGWEAMLKSMIDANWTITGSWPIDTERGGRLNSNDAASLASSVHIVCRPREQSNQVGTSNVGDWRDILQELPRRIHEWMPRLSEEGVVGADAIFACLGPALEIFSRYSHVEKASGQTVTLTEYLEQVWAAVAKEALTTVFKGADASGFEEDARLTAMWLWTLSAGQNGEATIPTEDQDDGEGEEEATGSVARGFVLECDVARKIAQGLGAHLESLTSLVEAKGEVARLIPVVERTRTLFRGDEESVTRSRRRRTPQLELSFITELQQAEEVGAWGNKGAPAQGATVLDRVHQSMILFAASRSEAMRRFLVDEGVGKDERFWRLAQVLSYLYPKVSDEKRWIDGVLARKKGLGF
jgi:putative DNA methylase